MNPTVSQTTCAYCGVGCGVRLPRANRRNIKVQGDTEHPANQGKLCIKGSHLGDILPLRNRLLYPSIANERVSWPAATNHIADKIRAAITEYGPQSVAFYLSGQLLTEDYYAANKLAKGFLGTANIDTNSRLCMSSAVASHTRAFGEDVVPGCYEDIELADLLIVTGSNLAWTHPILFQRFALARQQHPEKKLVVIDPRCTATAKEADLHLPIAPGADGQLFNALLVYLAEHDQLDTEFVAAHVDNLTEALASAYADVGESLSDWSTATGLTPELLLQFFESFAGTPKTTTLWSMGINQSVSGVDKGNAIINVHLATGRIGKPGATPFSVTGQPNAMGGREVGGLANQLAIHRGFDEASVEQVAQFWQAPNMARQPGLKANELFDACLQGGIKVLWVMATNPLASLPDANKIAAALANVDCVIVSDVVTDNDTLQFANVRLPAQAWGEKDGTVTNSERTISRQRAFLMSPGQARADWQAIADVAKALGYGQHFDWHHPHEIFREHARLTQLNEETPLKFRLAEAGNISFRDYQDWQPTQWPLSGTSTSKRLYHDGQFSTSSGKARMVAVQAQKPEIQQGKLTLNTGRLRDQWHTMTRTGLAQRLQQHSPDFELHIHPDDAQHHCITNGDLIEVRADVGSFYALARLETAQQPGQLFAPMHWNRQFANLGGVAQTIVTVTDPISGQPASKHSQVSIHKRKADQRGYLFCRADSETPEWLHQQTYFRQYTALGDLFRVFTDPANAGSIDKQLTQRYGEPVSQAPSNSLWFQFDEKGLVFWCALGKGEPIRPDAELLDYAAVTARDKIDPEALIQGQALPGVLPGKVICSCFGVSDKHIASFKADHPEGTFADLQDALKCGTNCGSCLSEVKDLWSEIPISVPST